MIELILCDDELSSLNRTKEFVSSISSAWIHELEITTYLEPKDLLKRLRSTEERTDILLLDIDMHGISGLDIAKIIRDEKRDVILIFLTAHDEFVYTSFEYAPFRYIRKEYIREELPSALTAAVVQLKAKHSAGIILKTSDGEMPVNIADIVYFQMENRRVCVYTKQGGQYTIWKKLKALKEEIDSKDNAFLQVHSGCVINLRHVKTLQNANILMEGDGIVEIPISRRRQSEVAAAISKYWRDHS